MRTRLLLSVFLLSLTAAACDDDDPPLPRPMDAQGDRPGDARDGGPDAIDMATAEVEPEVGKEVGEADAEPDVTPSPDVAPDAGAPDVAPEVGTPDVAPTPDLAPDVTVEAGAPDVAPEAGAPDVAPDVTVDTAPEVRPLDLATLNNCTMFEDNSFPPDVAARIVHWDPDLPMTEARCMTIKVGQSITFRGNFTSWPLEPRGGDTPYIPAKDENTGSDDADEDYVVTFNTVGNYGYWCPDIPAMTGVVRVIP